MPLLVIIALMASGCSSTRWADSAMWHNSDKVASDDLTDVFYFVSTDILEEKDAAGSDAYIVNLTQAEREAIGGEMSYAQDMFGDSLNFFSPYYRQFTMSALSLPQAEYMTFRRKASKDAASAFRYYLKHLNNGRPFILAGFSQGSMHLVDILRKIKKKDHQRMVVAYSMGYRLSVEDVKHPHVIAAKSADDRGTVVSFNSVASPQAIWPAVNGDAATCINPVNYRTDETPATFVFENDTLSVRVDTQNQALIVSSPRISCYRFPIMENLIKPGNLHHWDLLFYRDAIRENAIRRAYHSK